MHYGRFGFWYPTDRLDGAGLGELVRGAEALGCSHLWYPESTGYESLSLAGHLLAGSSRIAVGSSIANIYARDPVTARNGRRTLADFSGERFVLGLGVSHPPLVETLRGHRYAGPVATMRRYLEGIAADGPPLDDPDRPVVIAALGPRMLELAAELCRGAIPYNVTPEHTERARAILGPGRWLAVEQKICLLEDAEAARAAARRELARYMTLDNYRNNWLRTGFTAGDMEGGGSDRLMDAMVAWGSAAAVAERLRAHFDAGADQVCIQPIAAAPDAANRNEGGVGAAAGPPDWQALEAVLAAAGGP